MESSNITIDVLVESDLHKAFRDLAEGLYVENGVGIEAVFFSWKPSVSIGSNDTLLESIEIRTISRGTKWLQKQK